MQFVPYIRLNGNAREAVGFYQKIFQAENLGVITFGEMPEDPEQPLPEKAKGLVAHAAIKTGKSLMMFSDAFPDEPVREGDKITVCVMFDEPAKARQAFDALQDSGQVIMPLTETSFSPEYGIVKDKFGVTFQFYTEGNQSKIHAKEEPAPGE